MIRAPRVLDGTTVPCVPGASIDAALKRLKKKMDQAGILRELKRRETFTPPGQRRRRKAHRARQRVARDAARRHHGRTEE
jgi:small subunit ribosomal protein S21